MDRRRLSRVKEFLRAVLPPFVFSAARRLRRRFGGSGAGLSWPNPSLSDGVVELRLIDKSDLDVVERAVGSPEIRRRFGLLQGSAGEYIEYYRKASREQKMGAFAICDVDGECFGVITVELHGQERVEVGYWLLPEGRGRGRATRALRLVSRWALSQRTVARVELGTAPENAASQRVAERNGFQREGLHRSYQAIDGLREDTVSFALLPADLGITREPEPAEPDVSGLTVTPLSTLVVAILRTPL